MTRNCTIDSAKNEKSGSRWLPLPVNAECSVLCCALIISLAMLFECFTPAFADEIVSISSMKSTPSDIRRYVPEPPDSLTLGLVGNYKIATWSKTIDGRTQSRIAVIDTSKGQSTLIWQSTQEQLFNAQFSPQMLTAADWLYKGQPVVLVLRQTVAGYTVADPIVIVDGKVKDFKFVSEELKTRTVGLSVFLQTELVEVDHPGLAHDPGRPRLSFYWKDGFQPTSLTTLERDRANLEAAVGNAKMFLPSLEKALQFSKGESISTSAGVCPVGSASKIQEIAVQSYQSEQHAGGLDTPDGLAVVVTRCGNVQLTDIVSLFVSRGEIKTAASYSLGELATVEKAMVRPGYTYEICYRTYADPQELKKQIFRYNGSKAMVRNED